MSLSITERMFRDAPFASSWYVVTNPSGDCGARKLPACHKPPGQGVVVPVPFDPGPRSNSSYSLSRSQRRIASSSTSGADHRDPSPINSTWPVSDDTPSHSSFHGRQDTSWDRNPHRAATSGHDVRHQPTLPHTIPDRHPRYRSRERTLRRTRPSLVEGRGGEGVIGIWR